MTTERPNTHDSEEAVEPQEQKQEAAEERLQALQAELNESKERHLRLAADFENFKKRARQEQLETVQYATAALAERLLPVLDDFHRVMEHVPEGIDPNWLKGVQLTLQKLDEVLASVGVEPIETVGQRFDPKLHEAIGSEESDDHPEDTVVSELRRGYKLHDRVLRPALVKVSRRSATA
jgi:molecular chaperone GrpE